MISLKQIRAARGILGWSQSDLARECGLSVTAMNSIDREISVPRLKTITKMQEIFERRGIEFIEGHGVRLRDEVFKTHTYEGEDALSRYLDDVFETLMVTGGDGLHTFEDDEMFLERLETRKSLFNYCRNFIKYGLTEKLLVKEGSIHRYAPSVCSQYRWCSPELARQVGTSVYGNKYCIFFPKRIVVIENAAIAEGYRAQFKENWKHAKKPPPVHALFDEDLKRWGDKKP